MIKSSFLVKKMLRNVMVTAFAVAGSFLFSGNVFAANVTVTVPTERAIYQRNSDNVADMTIVATANEAAVVKAKVIDGSNDLCDWTVLEKVDGSDNEFKGVLKNIPGGGWYEVDVAAFDAAGKEIASNYVEMVGVGEVFITGGQSNSTNFGGAKTTAESDFVSAIDVKNKCWVHCEDSQPNNSGFNTGNGGGSPWPTTGDKLVESLGVPVGFVSTGVGGSLIAELADPNKNYRPIKEAIEFLEPYGCRAFLIHQGEADSGGMNGNPGTEMSVYKETFEQLIAQTREDAGYDLNWLIARVSYAWRGFNNPDRTKEVTETQTSICNNYNIFVGPDTDGLQGEDRHTDNLHLSEQGLIKHGTMWSECIINAFFTPRKLNADASITGGKIEQCDKELFGGQTVKLTAVPDEGYYLVPGSYKVTDANGEEVEITNDSFIMRAEDMTVFATFAKLPQYMLDLGAKIKEAKAINVSAYNSESVAALNTAIAAAEKVYGNVASTESEAVAANNVLSAAISKLVPIAQSTQTPPVNNVDNTVVKEPSTKKYVVKAKKKSITVKKGKQIKIKYTVTKGFKGKVKFVCSKKKIAEVSSKGKIKGLKKGKCKITIQLIKGKKVISKAVIKVTVK